MSLQAPLWRSIAVFRVASLAYAAFLLVVGRANYAHLAWAWVVLAAMAGWTLISTLAYARPARRTWPLLATDLLLTAAALLSTAALQYPSSLGNAAMPVTASWVAGPVLAWAVAGGIRAGAAAGAVLGACDLYLRHLSLTTAYRSTLLNATVLLLLAGIVVGYVSRLATRAEQALQRATEIEAASRERERLARHIHDSVLQVLALVQRRGSEVGGEAAEIGRLAGEQETALRRLIAADAGPALATGERDLRALLGQEASAAVSVVTPGRPGAARRHGRARDRGRRPRRARQRTAALWAAGAGLGAGGRRGQRGEHHGQGRGAWHPARAAGTGGEGGPARRQPVDLRPDP